jgi:hypothetical protein
MKRIFIILALILVAGLAMAQRQANWYSLMQIAATPTAQVTWTDSYSNNRAFYFNGDTNASGYAIDHSFNLRHAGPNLGKVISIPTGTNINGRVQYALSFPGDDYMIVAKDKANKNSFLFGVTNFYLFVWVYVTNWPGSSMSFISYEENPPVINDAFVTRGYNHFFCADLGTPFSKEMTTSWSSKDGTTYIPNNSWNFLSLRWSGTGVGGHISISVNTTNEQTDSFMDGAIGSLGQNAQMNLGGHTTYVSMQGCIGPSLMYTNIVLSLSDRLNVYSNTFMPNGNILY